MISITKSIIIGKPFNINSLEYYTTDSLDKLFMEYSYNFIYYIDGNFGIQLFFDNGDSIIYTEDCGYYPIFIDLDTNEICMNITDFNSNINKEFVILTNMYKYDDHCSIYPKFLLEQTENNLKFFDSMLFMPTPYIKYGLLKPGIVYKYDSKTNIWKQHKTDIKYWINTLNIKISPEDTLKYIIRKRYIDNNKGKVLLPLSSGYDTRLLLACLLDLNIPFDRYTYGIETDFVDTYLSNIAGNNIYCDFNSINFDKLVYNNIHNTNGYGDPYYWTPITKNIEDGFFSNYGIILSGNGHNEYFGYDGFCNRDMLKIELSTGMGHHNKDWFNSTGMITPFLYKKYRLSCLLNSNSTNKNEMAKKFTEKIYPSLVDIPYYDPNNPKSIFGLNFDFNTRKKYFEMYLERNYL